MRPTYEVTVADWAPTMFEQELHNGLKVYFHPHAPSWAHPIRTWIIKATMGEASVIARYRYQKAYHKSDDYPLYVRIVNAPQKGRDK